MLNKPFVVAALLLIALAALGTPVVACNTPVYRYAMYNWQTAPYIVFHFYEGEVAEEDKAVHAVLEKLTEEWPPEANVRVEPIDVSDEKKMEALPEFVIEAWKSHDGGKLPAHVIFSPWRGDVYAGRLDTDSVKKLIDSPARQKFGQLLEEGNATVMILLTCSDEEQNKKAEQALQELCKLADAGEIPVELQLPPLGIPGAEEGEQVADQPDPNKLGISVLKVDRNDPAEEFFVRMLMAVEEDLQEYADQPMIFAGYGRGRAMEPYIGKGITAENLVDVVAFLAGACSCMVKEQNPGADLLMKWNWDATADKMAENDPTLDYGPYSPMGYGEYPAETDTAGDDGNEMATESVTKDETPGESKPGEAAPSQASPDVIAMSNATPATEATSSESKPAEEVNPPEAKPESDAAATSEPSGAEPLTVSSELESPSDTASYANRRMLTYGLGFGAIAIGILLAGLALVLRRS